MTTSLRRFARVQYAGRQLDGEVVGNRMKVLAGNWLTDRHTFTDEVVALEAVTWLPPVQPRVILAVGRNYTDHAKELGNEVPKEPLFFLKAPGTLIAHQQPIRRPEWVGQVDFEGELLLIIGSPVKGPITAAAAEAAILGYTVGNDVTARQLQKQDGQWTRGKGFDTFAPMGPWMVECSLPDGWQIETRVNGEIRQASPVAAMLFEPARLVQDACRFMELLPGDVIYTGTPAGVGPIVAGDVVQVTVDGIGTLSNPVKSEDSSSSL